ncbi:unnamed protein product [Darwinula stevensoni]|uniref:Uncharacterized protein n=1 Tax=Darwinula stevensoni TaxID=69355 RepID=A0A7R8X8M6_9CRUS|nr:unnamed protein product [Darwinula stevensoni]CAG0889814.1 unnamed protein product [Darwinula stevensoni]
MRMKDDAVREYDGATPSGKEYFSDYRSGYDDYERGEGDADKGERVNSYPMENEDTMLFGLGLGLSGGDATLMDSTQQQTKPAKPENSSRKLKHGMKSSFVRETFIVRPSSQKPSIPVRCNVRVKGEGIVEGFLQSVAGMTTTNRQSFGPHDCLNTACALVAIFFSSSRSLALTLPAALQQVMPLQSEKDDPVREYDGTTPSGDEDYSDYSSGYDDDGRSEANAMDGEQVDLHPTENEDTTHLAHGLSLAGGDALLMDSPQQQTMPPESENSGKLKRERRQTHSCLACGTNSRRRFQVTCSDYFSVTRLVPVLAMFYPDLLRSIVNPFSSLQNETNGMKSSFARETFIVRPSSQKPSIPVRCNVRVKGERIVEGFLQSVAGMTTTNRQSFGPDDCLNTARALVAIFFSSSRSLALTLPAALQQVMPLQTEKDDPVREYDGTTPSGDEDYSDYSSGYDDDGRSEANAMDGEQVDSHPTENEDTTHLAHGLSLAGGDALLMDSPQQQTMPAESENSGKLKRERRQTHSCLACGTNSRRRYRRSTSYWG